MRDRRAKAVGSSQMASYLQSIADAWPLPNESVDIAIDVSCYFQLPTNRERAAYRLELLRALKPGGLYLLVIPAIADRRVRPVSQSGARDEVSVSGHASHISPATYDSLRVEGEFFFLDFNGKEATTEQGFVLRGRRL